MKRTALIVLTWNGLANLQHCLPSVFFQLGADDQLVVIDNGSTDDSLAWVATHYPAALLIRNETNRGFAAAVNQGIRATDSEFVVTLNDDTLVAPGWLDALLEAAQDERMGMCACKMLLAGDPTRFDSAGIEVDRAGIAWNRWFGEPVSAHPVAAPQEVFGPCGGAALYRRSMLDQVGLFDEDFFAYYEDVDLAWRARHAGWQCLYAPAAQVTHAHSATGNRVSGLKRYHLGRNKWWTILKNYPQPQLWLALPIILAYDLAAALGGCIHDRRLDALRGRRDAFRQWRRFWMKRTPLLVRVPLAPLRLLSRIRVGSTDRPI
ncbi:MAG: glycosyltransferase family 2 protein [Anaerolineae bacterium]|nr:glycosyltransferase family 2 protein [Anaerolineae bacterium]